MKAHCFDPKHAAKYGVNEAIVIRCFQGRIQRLQSSGLNLREGRTWTCASYPALVQHFPYWSEAQVRRTTAALVDQGVLLRKHFGGQDRRNWFAFVDEPAMLHAFFNADAEAEIVSDTMDVLPPETSKSTSAKQAKKRAGWVYLLRGESGHYKIGFASTVSRRITQLRTQAPYSIELIHSFPCADMDGEEKRLHQRFAEKRVIGEWFELSEADVAWIKTLDGGSAQCV